MKLRLQTLPKKHIDQQNGIIITELRNKLKNKKGPNRGHTKNWIVDIKRRLKQSEYKLKSQRV